MLLGVRLLESHWVFFQESLSLINSIDAQIKGKTSDLKNLKEKDQIQIDGENYSVKNKKKIDDGLLTVAYLSKV